MLCGAAARMDDDDDERKEGLGLIIWLALAMLLARLAFMVHEAIADAKREKPTCEECFELGDDRELATALEASLEDVGEKKEL